MRLIAALKNASAEIKNANNILVYTTYVCQLVLTFQDYRVDKSAKADQSINQSINLVYLPTLFIIDLATLDIFSFLRSGSSAF